MRSGNAELQPLEKKNKPAKQQDSFVRSISQNHTLALNLQKNLSTRT